MPLNMNTVGTGSGIGGGSGSYGIMGPLDISTKFRRTADEISVSSINSIGSSYYSKNDYKYKPDCFYKDKLYAHRQFPSSDSSGDCLCYYTIVVGDSSAESYFETTIVPTVLTCVFDVCLVDNYIWILGTTNTLSSKGTPLYIYRFDGTTLTQMTTDSITTVTSSDIIAIRPLISTNGDYCNKIIISQRQNESTGYVIWRYYELSDAGLNIIQYGRRAYNGMSPQYREESFGYYPEKQTFLLFDSFEHYWSLVSDQYTDSGITYSEVYMYEFTAKVNHDNDITVTENPTKKILKIPGTLSCAYTLCVPLCPISRTKWLICIGGNGSESTKPGYDGYWIDTSASYIRKLYIASYSDGNLSFEDVTDSICTNGWRSMRFMETTMFSMGSYMNLVNDHPYLFITRNYNYSPSLSRYTCLYPIKGNISVNFKDPFYDVTISLVNGDTVMCNAGIVSYEYNGAEYKCDNKTSLTVTKSGLFRFITNSYDSIHHPEFIIKSKNGAIGNLEIYTIDNDIYGYFQKGMKINDIRITVNGYQCLKNAYESKRIDIRL